jgi:hypothetical protein
MTATVTARTRPAAPRGYATQAGMLARTMTGCGTPRLKSGQSRNHDETARHQHGRAACVAISGTIRWVLAVSL